MRTKPPGGQGRLIHRPRLVQEAVSRFSGLQPYADFGKAAIRLSISSEETSSL
jgi:hypothetical protein